MQSRSTAAPSTRQRLPAAERRELILDAALDRFATVGYDQTSIAEIATRAGVTKPVLYDHFRSKQDLYVNLVDREAARMTAALTSTFNPEAPLEERLRALSSTAIAFTRRHSATSRLLTQTPVGDPVIREAHERFRAGASSATAAAILADPVFKASPGLSRTASAELLADLQVAVIERLLYWAIARPNLSSRALSEIFVEVLWTGLRGDR